MTIPFNVPPVQPIWFQPGPSNNEMLARGVHSVGQGLAGMLQMQQEQAAQAAQGDLLNAMIQAYLGPQPGTPDVVGMPAMAPPSVLPGTMTQSGVGQMAPVVPPSPVMGTPSVAADPLATALRGKPGTVVYGALGKAQPLLQGAVSTRLENQKFAHDLEIEKLKQAGKAGEGKTYEVIWEGDGPTQLGWTHAKDSPLLTPLLKPNGEQATRKNIVQPGQGTWKVVTNKKTGQKGMFNPGTKELYYLPDSLGIEGTVTAPERAAGALYGATAPAWQEAKALLPKIKLTFDQSVLMMRAINGNAKAMETAVSNGWMTEENKQFVTDFLEVMQNIVYNTTGKQINDNEFARRVREFFPIVGDSDQTIAAKVRRIEGGIKVMHDQGMRFLRDAADFGIDNPTLEEVTGQKTTVDTDALTPEERDALGLP